MSWRYRGRAQLDTSYPVAQAVCDRCGTWYSHSALRWQFDYRGSQLQNLHILVCSRCLDKPSVFYRPIIVPPDPIPIKNPRPEWFAQDENNYRVTQNDDLRITQDDEPRVLNGGGEDVP